MQLNRSGQNERCFWFVCVCACELIGVKMRQIGNRIYSISLINSELDIPLFSISLAVLISSRIDTPNQNALNSKSQDDMTFISFPHFYIKYYSVDMIYKNVFIVFRSEFRSLVCQIMYMHQPY